MISFRVRPLRFGVVAAAVASASATALAAAPFKLPNFPVAAGGSINDAVALADLNGDKTPEIVTASGGKLLVFGSDGKPFKNFPLELPPTKKGGVGPFAIGSPAVGDIDGDGKPDIAVAVSYGETADGVLVAYKADGKALWAKPLALTGLPASGPTIGEVHGKPAVVIGTAAGVFAANGKGTLLTGFPVKLEAAVSSPVAIGRFTASSKPVLAVGAKDGKVHVLNDSGKAVEGFPLATAFAVSGSPLFADIDDDGQNELVVASQDFKVYAAKADGTQAAGYPVATGYRIYGGPAVGDFDHDGKLKVVVASSDGKVYAWGDKGKPVKGFPVLAGKTHGSVVVGDGARTGKDQIYVVSSEGKLYGFDGAGKKLEGFPIDLGETTASPVLGYLDRDAAVSVLIGNVVGDIVGYKLPHPGEIDQSPLSWPAPGHDASHQSHFGPYPSRYAKVALSTKAPRFGEPLRLNYEYSDLDGDPEPATRIRWTLNGQPAPQYDGKKEIPGDKLKKRDKWKVTVQSPEDFQLYKDGPLATIATTAEATVADTPPVAPKVTIEPNPARTTDTLVAKVVTPSTDADGDPVTYHYLWQRNGRLGPLEQTVKPGMAKRGEHWRVLVTPNDGEKDGATSDADLFIQNTPPGAPEITLGPANPTTETDIKVSITKEAADADSDKLTYRYQFYINGEAQAFVPDRDFLPKGAAHKSDVVKVEVWAFDGGDVGPRVSAQITVVDAPPEQPKVAIAPQTPHTGDLLTSGLLLGGRDPDRDPVTYRISWTRNGQPAGQPNATSIPAAEVHKGETWAVTYVPNDGSLDGPAASAQVTVVNSAPTHPRVAVSNASPAVADSVTVSISEASKDVDGDAIRYEYKWAVEEAKGDDSGARVAKMAGASTLVGASSGDKTTLTTGEFHKHQRILVTVTPIDAENVRGPAATVEILPRNTPPSAPFVALEPAAPTTETGLNAVVTTPATDADADKLTYHYKWYRDGVVQTDVGDRASLKAGEVKRGEQWHVVVRASDGESDGPVAEATTIIKNVTPVAPKVVIFPPQPTTVTGVTCQTVTPARDADGDAITVHYTWLRDGQPYSIPDSADAVPGNAIKDGQSWTCQVLARDGEATSEMATASATVVDAAPEPPKVSVEPKVAKAGDALTCAITDPAVDPDGDRVKYEFHWQGPKDAKLPKLADPARIPNGIVKKGQVWTCSVVATDGRANASPVSAKLSVGNTAPQVAEFSVEPWGAIPGMDLTCAIVKQAVDVDGDAVRYAFTWTRNGTVQPFANTSTSIPGRLVKAGDKWTCGGVPSDGEEDGPSSASADMTVGQAPPDEE